MIKPWEKTKAVCTGFSKMPPLTEANLSNPSFRTVTFIINSLISYSNSLWYLFDGITINYSKCDSTKDPVKIMDYLIQFVDEYSGSGKLGCTGNDLIGVKRKADKIHLLIQRFAKISKIGTITVKQVKQFYAAKSYILPQPPVKVKEPKEYHSVIKLTEENTKTKKYERGNDNLQKSDKKNQTIPAGKWGLEIIEDEGQNSAKPKKSLYELLRELENLKMQKRDLINKQNKNKTTIRKLENDSNELKAKLDIMNGSLDELKNQAKSEDTRKDLQAELNDLRQQLNNKRVKVEELRNQKELNNREFNDALEPIRNKIEKIKEKNKEYKEAMDLNESVILDSGRFPPDEIEQREREKKKLEDENDKLNSQLEELKAEQQSQSRILRSDLMSKAAEIRKLKLEKERVQEVRDQLKSESKLWDE